MTKPVAPAAAPARFIGSYGTDWKPGVLVEHLEAFVLAGGIVRPAASGSGALWAVVDRRAYRVVCAEIIEVATEDGPISGRCGQPVKRHGACERHAEIIEEWAAQTEAETIAWERDRAGLAQAR